MTGAVAPGEGFDPVDPSASSTAEAAVTVTSADQADIATMVDLHRSAFPASVLSRLGPDLVRLQYESLWSGPHDVVGLIARHGPRDAGFLVGGVFRGSTVRFVSDHKARLVRAVVRRPQVLLSRAVWGRVALGLRLLVDRRRLPGPERPARVPNGSFGVLVLAVDPPARRRGVGKALLAAAADEARAAGFAAMHLTTYPGSDAARFYASQGWTALLEPDGSWEGLMTRSLAEVPGGQVPDEGTIDEPQTP